ncbi:MAG TPA: hypothetical protein DHU80_00695 [Cryomorphaceae bacterium]|nr:hypothetical protein [Cryomorphaceae bacterium]HBB80356.1 hypothetical protein [Cryomorphaceae bacterium]HCY24724.1 hypothetical protein [Cryomorphaceae bacterium]
MMNFPKFLVADNTDLPDAIYIVHTEFPSFILNLENDEVKWMDDISDEDEGDLTKTLEGLIDEAEAFYIREVDRYNI